MKQINETAKKPIAKGNKATLSHAYETNEYSGSISKITSRAADDDRMNVPLKSIPN